MRYAPYAASVLLLAASLVLVASGAHQWGWGVAVFGVLALLGTWSRSGRRCGSTSSRPTPPRFPFSRQQRALVYQRAKSVNDKRPFGSLQDVYATDYEWINHSITPSHIASHDFRVTVGAQRTRPYSGERVQHLGDELRRAFRERGPRAQQGRQAGGFYHDTGEGSISPYHREHGGDLIWEIGRATSAAATRTAASTRNGSPRNAADDAGADDRDQALARAPSRATAACCPGPRSRRDRRGARRAGRAWTASRRRGTAPSTPRSGCSSSSRSCAVWPAASRSASSCALGHPWEWFGIAKAMLETGIVPDFIVVDGAEGGTGAAPAEFIDHVGVPMHEALMLVHNTLVGLGLRDPHALAGAGKIVSAFDIARMAMGADWCNAGARLHVRAGLHPGPDLPHRPCPTGVTTQDPKRWRSLDVADKGTRSGGRPITARSPTT
jgi:hypothetical protein